MVGEVVQGPGQRGPLRQSSSIESSTLTAAAPCLHLPAVLKGIDDLKVKGFRPEQMQVCCAHQRASRTRDPLCCSH